MKVKDYQRIYEINQTTLDDVERVAFMICYLFDKSAEEVDNLPSLKFLKLADKVQKRLTIKAPFYNRYKLQTEASRITLGQFIECQHWLKNDPIQVIHLIAASLYLKNKDHQADAEMFTRVNIGCIYDQVQTFMESWKELLESYSGLFEIEAQTDEDGEPVKPVKPHPFLDRYGWIFSAKEIAEHEGIKLDQAMDLPIIQALNVSSYLKSKAAYIKWQSKQ